ncbi:MAG: hemerythrin domain-containing protein [Bacteroidales bacterium]|nr:hemerythrin domain-containing protein [Bacteroidales bacterium]
MTFTKDMKMADLIHKNYLLLSIISRFGIPLGFGDKSVEEICNEYNVNTYFFLDIVNSYSNENYITDVQHNNFSIHSIVRYLRKTHKFYIDQIVPEINCLITNLYQNCFQQKDNVKLLLNFFDEYKNELLIHIKREEDVVYPYVLNIENAYETKKISKKLVAQMKNYSINEYLNEHSNIEEKLLDLKNLIIKYLPPTSDYKYRNKVLAKLFQLENDINDHSRIEEKVMAPKILEMEKFLFSHFSIDKQNSSDE